MRRLRVLSLGVTLALAGAWFVLLRPVFMGGHTGYILVAGHSMEPDFYTGDLAILHKHPTYRVGDVVAYKVQGGGVIIHRIVGGTARKGYVVKGDNKRYADFYRPTPRNIIGSVWVRVPKVGLAIAVAHDRRNLPVVAALFGFAAVLSGALKPKGKARDGPEAAE